MSNPTNKYTDGLFYNEPRQGAPDFIIGSLSFSKARFLNWLDSQAPDAKDYVRVDIKRGQEGKPYCQINDWKPTR